MGGFLLTKTRLLVYLLPILLVFSFVGVVFGATANYSYDNTEVNTTYEEAESTNMTIITNTDYIWNGEITVNLAGEWDYKIGFSIADMADAWDFGDKVIYFYVWKTSYGIYFVESGEDIIVSTTGSLALTDPNDVSYILSYDKDEYTVEFYVGSLLIDSLTLAAADFGFVSEFMVFTVNGETNGFTAGTVTLALESLYAYEFDSVETGAFWVYLYDGDFIGLFYALLLSVFQNLSIGIGFVVTMFLSALYLRNGSLLVMCIVWLLIGSFLIVLIPAVSALAIFFMGLGITGLMWKLFRPQQQ